MVKVVPLGIWIILFTDVIFQLDTLGFADVCPEDFANMLVTLDESQDVTWH